MDDLISRQAAMDICDTFKGNGSASAVIKGYIKALPPVEQKQGKWIINLFLSSETSKVYNCSICNQLYMDNSFTKISYAHYCSNCGAKMEVGDENSN